MKKFLIAAISLILLVLLLHTAYDRWGFYIDFRQHVEVTTFTAIEGKEILVDTGDGLQPYEIKGVDLGSSIPGHATTEYSIDTETYLRWFQMIQDMGSNTIRVYTMQSDDFYDAVYAYNKDNPNPLYVLHGVWVNDYVQNSHVDAYDDSFLQTFITDCRTLVDVIHGKKKVNLGYNTTSVSGSYDKDISSWVIGYILGPEWEDATVAYTDHMQEENNSYQGTYMYTTEDASAFEAMLAQVGDQMIRYETDKYKQQRLMAFSNCTTTDPMDYPEELNQLFKKCAKIDVEHIATTEEFLSGQFASYHVYSYSPDYLSHYDSWKEELSYANDYRQEDGSYNTYGIYLKMLTEHHDMPVVISEFGAPTSRGRAQLDYDTARSRGYMSEQEQGDALVYDYQDIRKAGCAGSAIYCWQDEWFKRSWNTMANVDQTKTQYWSDVQSNQQFFGLLSFDPGEETSVCYTDGDVSEWTQEDLLQDKNEHQLYAKYDEKFLYLRIHKDGLNFGNETLYLPVDVTPKSGSYYAEGEEIKFDRQADFLIVLDGVDNSNVFVQERYDVFETVFAESYGMRNVHFDPPDKDSPIFEKIYLALQVGSMNALRVEDQLSERLETGKLTYGNGNPQHADYNSVSDFIVSGEEIELRIPWQLLNFSNPSEMQIHDDYFEQYGIENLGIEEIYIGLGSEQDSDIRIRMSELQLNGWGKNPTYHERLKPAYYSIQKLWSEGS